jgi:pimeloyl-ACP methyl ester carboxylesterase
MACILVVRHSRLFASCAIHSGTMYGAASSPMQARAAMWSGPSAASIDKARRLVREAGESEVAVPTLVIHGERDATVNPVNADRIIEQLRAHVPSTLIQAPVRYVRPMNGAKPNALSRADLACEAGSAELNSAANACHCRHGA